MYKNGKEIEEQDKHNFWQNHVGSWEQSGIRQSEYCRRHGLNIKVFGYWKRKLCSKTQAALSFVPVRIKPSYPATSVNASTSLRLVVGNGYGIDIGDGFNPDTLRRLIDTLRQRV